MASSLDALLGQLKKLQQGAPYDASLATAIQNAQRQAADIDRSYTMGRSDIEKGHGDITRDLGVQRGTNVKNTMGKFADTGLLHSGIHATAQGDVESDYQRGMTEAAERRLSGFRGLDEARRASESGIQDMLVGAQQDYTRRQAESQQAQAAEKAQAAWQQQQNALAQQAAAQQAAMLRAIAAATGGGGGGYGGGGMPPPPPDPTKFLMNSGMTGNGQYVATRPDVYDYTSAQIRKIHGDDAARKWMSSHQRVGGLTPIQRAFLSPAQRRNMMNARRNS